MKPSFIWNNPASDAYVWDVRRSALSGEFFALLSNGVIRHVRDVFSGIHQDVGLNPDPDVVTAMCCDTQNGSVVWTCTERGSLAVWDFRTKPSAPAAFASTGVAHMCSIDVGFGGVLVACGTDEETESRVVFWDARRLAPALGQYDESFNGAVTQLRFNDNGSFVTGSVDGLVCVFDVTQSSEDEALSSVLNLGAPCSRLGYFGSRGVYATTSNETLRLFDTTSSKSIGQYENEDTRICLPSFEANYLVDCLWEARSERLICMAGNRDGSVMAYETALDRFLPLSSLNGAHDEVVRCAVGFESEAAGFCVITGAEDGRMCLWTPTSS